MIRTLNRVFFMHSMETESGEYGFYYIDFSNRPTPASFCLFSFFSSTNFTEKTVGFSGIQTQIVRVQR